MNLKRSRLAHAILAVDVGTAGSATGAREERPSPPADVKVQAVGTSKIVLRWTNTSVPNTRFELEQSLNGAPVTPPRTDLHLLGGINEMAKKPDIRGIEISSLPVDSEHCFRIWSRYGFNDVQSARPRPWACGRTLPHPPLAPLDVRARRRTLQDQKPEVTWSTPDQSEHRRIERYEIERQSPPGPNRPWIAEGTLPGPNGAQSASTQLAFRFVGAVVSRNVTHVYRVCAVNPAGRACSAAAEVAEPDVAQDARSKRDLVDARAPAPSIGKTTAAATAMPKPAAPGAMLAAPAAQSPTTGKRPAAPAASSTKAAVPQQPSAPAPGIANPPRALDVPSALKPRP